MAEARLKKLHESYENEQMKGKRLLSSEYSCSGYVTGKKPQFTRLNILGNMNK